MANLRREQTVEFVCTSNINDCEDDPPTYMVEGHFLADGTFMPDDVDDMGSSADCPECGETGEPTDPDVTLADW